MPSSRMETADRAAARRVFVSYSRRDRQRVDGLAVLLEALGHEVFVDRRRILPGERWRDRLLRGLDEADVLLVFWTRFAADSKWVRRECRLFEERFPEGLLVPVRGDETTLSPYLEERQYLDLFPLLNELLQLQRELTDRGIRRTEIRRAILARLAEAGIDLDERRRRRLLGLFGLGSLLGLSAAYLLGLGGRLAESALQATAQLTLAQAGLVVATAVAGGAVCKVVDVVTDPGPLAALGRGEGALVEAVLEAGRSGRLEAVLREIPCPNLEGLTRERAGEVLRENLLRVGTVSTLATDKARAGTVLAQQPGPAASLVAGDAVNLILAAPPADSGERAPATGLAERLDLVFVIDVTGSMGAQLEVVRKVILDLTRDLRQRGVDVRYAGYTITDRVPFEGHLPFASTQMDRGADLERFRRWLAGLALQTAENPTAEENGLDALRHAFGLSFDPDGEAAIVLVSDAPPLEAGDPGSPTQLTVETLMELEPAGLRIFVASPSDRYALLGHQLAWPPSAEQFRYGLIAALRGVNLDLEARPADFAAWSEAANAGLSGDQYRFAFEDWLLICAAAAAPPENDPFQQLLDNPASAADSDLASYFAAYGNQGRRDLQRALSLGYGFASREFGWLRRPYSLDLESKRIGFEGATGLHRGLRALLTRLDRGQGA